MILLGFLVFCKKLWIFTNRWGSVRVSEWGSVREWGRVRGRVGDCPIGGLSVYYVFPITTDTSLKKECNCRPGLPTTSFITHFQFFNSSILQFFNSSILQFFNLKSYWYRFRLHGHDRVKVNNSTFPNGLLPIPNGVTGSDITYSFSKFVPCHQLSNRYWENRSLSNGQSTPQS